MAAAGRTLPVKLSVALALLGGSVAAAPSAPAALQRGVDLSAPAADVSVDPALTARLASGPTPVLFGWDKEQTDRAELRSYLESQNMDAYLFQRVSVGYACAGSMADVHTLAGAPGALSVYGDHQMTTATDKSVRTAYNGDPQAVWQGMGYTGKGVGIAVVDTGIDATHPDLEYGRRTKVNVRVLFSHREVLGPYNEVCPPLDLFTSDINKLIKDFTGQDTPPMEDTEITSGHGTHLAGVAAGDGTASGGQYKGMAPEADLLGVAVTDSVHVQQSMTDPNTGNEFARPNTLGVIAAINMLLLRLESEPVKTKVILAGWGQEGRYDPWSPLALTIKDASDFDLTVVLPAGNGGPAPSACGEASSCHFNQWGASPWAITVAAGGPKTSRQILADFSSRGDPVPRQERDEMVRYQPTLTAPGAGVISTRRVGIAPYATLPGSILQAETNLSTLKSERLNPQYQTISGTSVAAAHIAGTIAVMQQAAVQQKGCFLSYAQVRSILTQTATPMSAHPSSDVGAGMVDATQAVSMARAVPPVHSMDPYRCPGTP